MCTCVVKVKEENIIVKFESSKIISMTGRVNSGKSGSE